jgi:hypothetical protein
VSLAAGASLGAALVLQLGLAIAVEPGALAVACGSLALIAAVGALGPASVRGALGVAVAAARLSITLIALAVWRGEGRVLWAALAVWFAVRDTRDGLSSRRPLAPAGIALAVALIYNAWRPGPAGARAILVAIVAAVAAARTTHDEAAR